MSSPASIKKHPLHPMLVGFPIGLWVFALVCDVVHAVSGSAIWQTVATFCVAGGIVGALLAAVPGLIDYFSIDEARDETHCESPFGGQLGRSCNFCD